MGADFLALCVCVQFCVARESGHAAHDGAVRLDEDSGAEEHGDLDDGWRSDCLWNFLDDLAVVQEVQRELCADHWWILPDGFGTISSYSLWE